MTFYVYYLNTNKYIRLWDYPKNATEVIGQLFDNGNKTRKSKYKVREYNGRKYIIVLTHRYYLDKFQKVEV